MIPVSIDHLKAISLAPNNDKLVWNDTIWLSGRKDLKELNIASAISDRNQYKDCLEKNMISEVSPVFLEFAESL